MIFFETEEGAMLIIAPSSYPAVIYIFSTSSGVISLCFNFKYTTSLNSA